MSSKISALTTLDVVTNDDYLVLARTSNTSNYKYRANSLFTTLVEIGHSTPVYLIDNISSTNALSQRGLKSGSSILTLAVDVSGSDKNVLFDIDESAIDLSLCDNSTSAFLTAIDLTTGTGTLPVANGGTGLSTLTDKAILITQDSGADALTATAMINSGELVIGGTSGPAVATLTAGDNITITNGDGSITIASGFTTAKSTLDMDGYNIDLDSGWISVDGVNGGIAMGADQAYVGSSANEFYDGSVSLNLDDSLTFRGGANHTLSIVADTTGGDLTVLSGTAQGAGNNGGDLLLKAGNGAGSGDGGHAILQAGSTSTGSPGGVYLRNVVSGVTYDAVSIEENDVYISQGDLIVNKTGKGLQVPRNTGSQNSLLTEGVTINEVSGRVSLARVALAAETQAEFTVTNSTVTANSFVFVSLISPGAASESVNAIVVAQAANITNGSFDVVLTNVSASTASDTQARLLQFFVVN